MIQEIKEIKINKHTHGQSLLQSNDYMVIIGGQYRSASRIADQL